MQSQPAALQCVFRVSILRPTLSGNRPALVRCVARSRLVSKAALPVSSLVSRPYHKFVTFLASKKPSMHQQRRGVVQKAVILLCDRLSVPIDQVSYYLPPYLCIKWLTLRGFLTETLLHFLFPPYVAHVSSSLFSVLHRVNSIG
jgi:hypothetical protein